MRIGLVTYVKLHHTHIPTKGMGFTDGYQAPTHHVLEHLSHVHLKTEFLQHEWIERQQATA
jgi:hypothetical protein